MTARPATTGTGTVTAPLPARRPGTHRPATPRPAQQLDYDLDRTWDLLAETTELPATQRGLLKILTEYRKALHALATQLEAIHLRQQVDQPGQPDCQSTTESTSQEEHH